MGKVTIKNIFSFIQGNMRYKVYDTKYGKYLIRKKVREQIEARIASMNKLCYVQGSCVTCGCVTVKLQMANKACDGFCYPPMLGSRQWTLLKAGYKITDTNGIAWKLQNGKFVCLNKPTEN